MSAFTWLVIICCAAQGAARSSVMLEVPHALRSAALETSVVCRDAQGRWSGLDKWGPLDPRSPVVTAGNECRVLLRRAGNSHYLVTGAVRRGGSQPLAFQVQPLRTVRAGRVSSQPYWVGEATGAECMRTSESALCMFVPVDDHGALVALDESGLKFALSAAGARGDWTVWRSAAWARLVRVRVPDPQAWNARVVTLEPALKHGVDLLQQPRVSHGAVLHRLGDGMLWVEGGETHADELLEVNGRGAATKYLELSSVRGSPLTILDLSLQPEEVIEGEVRGEGRLLSDATVSLFRFLTPLSGASDEDERRPMQRAGEARTDATGRFRFSGLARGDYEMTVSHPRRGRARLVVRAPSLHTIKLQPRSLVRGRVLTRGVPVAGATVTVLPSYEAMVTARNPAMLIGESVQTSADGRFEIVAPEEGTLTLTAVREGAAARVDLGDARSLPAILEIGDVRINEAFEVVVLLDLPPRCTISAAGPLGQPGILLQQAQSAGPGRWLLHSALEGRWLIEASCDGTDVPLDVNMVEFARGNRELVRLSPRREPAFVR